MDWGADVPLEGLVHSNCEAAKPRDIRHSFLIVDIVGKGCLRNTRDVSRVGPGTPASPNLLVCNFRLFGGVSSSCGIL